MTQYWSGRQTGNIHEAGHGIAGVALGLRIHRLSVEPCGGGVGQTLYQSGGANEAAVRAMLLAGVLALAMTQQSGTCVPPPHASNLADDAVAWRRLTPDPEASLEDHLELVYQDLERAAPILERHWAALEGLATRLELDSVATGLHVLSAMDYYTRAVSWSEDQRTAARELAAEQFGLALLLEREEAGLSNALADDEKPAPPRRRPSAPSTTPASPGRHRRLKGDLIALQYR